MRINWRIWIAWGFVLLTPTLLLSQTTVSGGGGLASGASTPGCTSVIHSSDASSTLSCNAASVVNGSVSTAGRSILTIADTISGSSATSNFLNITGTFNGTLTAETIGLLLSFTGDNDAQAQSGIKSIFTPKAVSGDAVAVFGSMLGDASVTNSVALGGKFTGAVTSSAGSSLRGGVLGFASTTVDSSKIVGLSGVAYTGNQNSNAATGVFGVASRVGGTPTSLTGVYGTTNINATNYAGGYFELAVNTTSDGNLSPAAFTGTAALIANNRSQAADIFQAQDNGTAVFTIADGGRVTSTQGIDFSTAGSTSAPNLSFNDADTGWYSFTPGFITATVNNSAKWTIGTTETNQVYPLSFGGAINTPDSGFQRLAAGVVASTLGTTTVGGWVQNSGGDLALNGNYTNATATFSNTALSATLVSGRTYSIDIGLIMSDSTAADGVKIDFNGGAATITVFNVNCFLTNDTTGATVNLTAATSAALATVINAGAMASTGNHLMRCSGLIVPSSSNTFILRAAQNAHSTGTLTINRGSWMILRDMRPL